MILKKFLLVEFGLCIAEAPTNLDLLLQLMLKILSAIKNEFGAVIKLEKKGDSARPRNQWARCI